MNGVIVASDQGQEWLLPWWWDHYRSRNDFPVAFVDFGMSEKAKRWCRKRGALIPFNGPKNFVTKIEDPELIQKWEGVYGKNVWTLREAWYNKPFAMLQSPFEKTVWTDLDCEIVGSIAPLFALEKVAVARERSVIEGDIGYNAGVVVFPKDSPSIKKWTEVCAASNHLHLSDQDILTALIDEGSLDVIELPDIYNWRMKFGVNFGAVIIHWVGGWGKEMILNSIKRKSN